MKALAIVLFAIVALGGSSAQDQGIDIEIRLDTSALDEVLAQVQTELDNLQILVFNARSTVNSAVSTIISRLQEAQSSINAALRNSGNFLVQAVGGLIVQVSDLAVSLIATLQRNFLAGNANIAAFGQEQLTALVNLVSRIRAALQNPTSQAQIDAATEVLRAIAALINRASGSLGNVLGDLLNAIIAAVSDVLQLLQEVLEAIINGDVPGLVVILGRVLLSLGGAVAQVVIRINSAISDADASFQSIIGGILDQARAQLSNSGIQLP